MQCETLSKARSFKFSERCHNVDKKIGRFIDYEGLNGLMSMNVDEESDECHKVRSML